MFEDIVSTLLSTYLGDYLEGISRKDLKLSLWKGDVELKNLVKIHLSPHFIACKNRSLGFSQFAHPSEGRIRGNTQAKSRSCVASKSPDSLEEAK